MQLKIQKVTKQSGYIEVGYEMTLDVPQEQQAGVGATTIVKGETAGFTNGTGQAAIKAELVSRLNAAQTEINNDTSYAYWGLTYNGSTWA